ncbi:hypothetical protein FJ959_09885 [Mesorhizobium sp. B2-2-4]|uniref:hypothetical protein n=1 Tax=unclassified Mesorhizobium TaxID=325217 RepID=UPI00112A0633|nr:MULTISPECIES: hypothetical protein [unclassified Mesorhizobium]TPM59169.1 hypothetical protein FJ959_09885 [Mesorhizobium sp. B2-2-4]TPM67654.1 hypothetical protein FJ965_11025 [Mesorhizobium sp. B2-2-1]TPN66935.1 hypothetical protein FJ984_15885 [Mesorhizobium sp. B1-1-3]
METINQPSSQPTNKVAVATAATAAWAIIVSVGSLALQNLAPTWYSPDLIAAVSSGVPVLLVFIAGWFTRDKPNVVVVQQ